MVKERHLEKLLKSNYKWDMESFINNVKYYDSYDWFKEIEYLRKNCIFKKEYEEYETFLKNNMYKYIEFCHLEQEKTYNVYKIITIIDNDVFPEEIKLLVILDNMCYFILPDVFLDMLIDSGKILNYETYDEILINPEAEKKHILFCEHLPNLEISYNIFCTFLFTFIIYFPTKYCIEESEDIKKLFLRLHKINHSDLIEKK